MTAQCNSLNELRKVDKMQGFHSCQYQECDIFGGSMATPWPGIQGAGQGASGPGENPAF